MRTVDQIQGDISWKHQRMNDSQEHAQIVKFEKDIEELQRELKAAQNAAQLPTPDETMVDDKKRNPMSKHKDEDVEALRLAAKALDEFNSGPVDNKRPDVYERLASRLHAALAKLEPKPDKVCAVQAFLDLPEYTRTRLKQLNIDHDDWIEIRELTAVEATTAPVQKWNVPTFEQMPKNIYGTISLPHDKSVSEWVFNAIRDQIVSMNEVN
jgi:hypothetical protein